MRSQLYQAEDDFRNKATDLQKIYVKNMRGQMVPLMTMVSLEQTVGAASITRFNQYRSVQFSGQPSAGKSSGEAMIAMENVSKKVLPLQSHRFSPSKYNVDLSSFLHPARVGSLSKQSVRKHQFSLCVR